MSRRLVWRREKKQRIWKACALFGMLYGAAGGALFGALTCFVGPGGIVAGTMVRWSVLGLWFGLLGGCMAGFVGSTWRTPVGWLVGGLLGGLLTARMCWWSWGWRVAFHVFSPLAWFIAGAVLLGGALGWAVGLGFRFGVSSVPGVQKIVGILDDDTPVAIETRAPRAASEVTPARAPHGRGDEAAPGGG
jgi:MFS family permease